MVISKLRRKLYKMIQEYGINSEEAYQTSIELDNEIDKYIYNGMKYHYERSLIELEKYINKKGDKLTAEEWNKHAKKYHFLSTESMKYIGNIEFE